MYAGALPPVSNRASWIFELQVIDEDTGDLADLSDLSIVLEVRDPLTCTTMLTASTANGKITIPSTGTFKVSFSRDDMAGLCARTHQVGVTLADDEDTIQIIVGTLPVLFGVIQR